MFRDKGKGGVGKQCPRYVQIAIPRYTHWTDSSDLSSTFLKITWDASTGATTVPTAWKAWASVNRISEYFGGPQVAMKGLAAASSVERPLPTMNMEPQNPPKLFIC